MSDKAQRKCLLSYLPYFISPTFSLGRKILCCCCQRAPRSNSISTQHQDKASFQKNSKNVHLKEGFLEITTLVSFDSSAGRNYHTKGPNRHACVVARKRNEVGMRDQGRSKLPKRLTGLCISAEPLITYQNIDQDENLHAQVTKKP